MGKNTLRARWVLVLLLAVVVGTIAFGPRLIRLYQDQLAVAEADELLTEFAPNCNSSQPMLPARDGLNRAVLELVEDLVRPAQVGPERTALLDRVMAYQAQCGFEPAAKGDPQTEPARAIGSVADSKAKRRSRLLTRLSAAIPVRVASKEPSLAEARGSGVVRPIEPPTKSSEPERVIAKPAAGPIARRPVVAEGLEQSADAADAAEAVDAADPGPETEIVIGAASGESWDEIRRRRRLEHSRKWLAWLPIYANGARSISEARRDLSRNLEQASFVDLLDLCVELGRVAGGVAPWLVEAAPDPGVEQGLKAAITGYVRAGRACRDGRSRLGFFELTEADRFWQEADRRVRRSATLSDRRIGLPRSIQANARP